MKHAISILSLLLAASAALSAQDLRVSSYNGTVELLGASGWMKPEPFSSLELTDSVRMAPYASLTIIDRSNDRLYACQKEGTCTVAQLIEGSSSKGRKMPAEVISYLWNSLRGRNSADSYRTSAGVVYRDEDINLSLAAAVASGAGNLPVRLEMVRQEDMQPTGGSVREGTVCLFRICNLSTEDLFVNVIDIDADGNMAACIPVSSAEHLSQLLIPACSEVILSSFPVVITGPAGQDRLILITNPEVFDTDAVIGHLKAGRTTSQDSRHSGIFTLGISILP